MNPLIGNNIKHVRLLKSFTQEYMAEKLGVSTAAYSNIENDKVKVSEDLLIKISQLLDVSVEFLKEFSPNQIFHSVNHSQISNENATQNFTNIKEELITALSNQLKEKDEQIKLLLQQLSILIGK